MNQVIQNSCPERKIAKPPKHIYNHLKNTMIVRYSGITGANIVYQTRYQKNNTNIQKCFFFL